MTSLAAPLRSRRVVTVALLVALVLGTTACGAGRPPAASVRDIDISAQRVDDLVAALEEANPDLADQFTGDGEDTYRLTIASNLLAFLMDRAAGASEANARGLEPVPAEEARTSLEGFLGGSANPEMGTAAMEALPEGTRDWMVDLEARRLALQAELGAEASAADDPQAQARELYDSDPTLFTQTCLRFLAVAEDDVPSVQDRLDAGEDFGDVSGEVSIDEELAATNGGDQCVSLTQYESQMEPTLFADLSAGEAGDVLGPYPFDEEGNVYLIEITSIDVPPFEAVADQIMASLPADDGSAAMTEMVSEILDGDDVRVDPRFGRWDGEAGTIVPPRGVSTPIDAAATVDAG